MSKTDNLSWLPIFSALRQERQDRNSIRCIHVFLGCGIWMPPEVFVAFYPGTEIFLHGRMAIQLPEPDKYMHVIKKTLHGHP